MVVRRVDLPTAWRTAAAAMDDQAVVARLDFDAAGREACRDRAEPVALLDAQLGEAGKARRAVRAGLSWARDTG